jgi:NADH-quinone oxidoreductase subunit C
VTAPDLLPQLQGRFGEGVMTSVRYAARDGIQSLRVPADRIVEIVGCLRDETEPRFSTLSSVTATDEKPERPRFRVVYHLYSFATNSRLRLVAQVPEEVCNIDSVTPLFPGANWQEREVFDMFGITFLGHPELKRILMPDDYGHHPLRKEFPLRGIEPERLYREWDQSRKA